MNEKCHGKLVHKQYITGDTSEKKGTDHENRFKKIQWIADRYISSLFMYTLLGRCCVTAFPGIWRSSSSFHWSSDRLHSEYFDVFF